MGFLKPDDSGVTYDPDELKIFAATHKIGGAVMWFGVAGVVVIGFWAWGAFIPGPNQPSFLACFGVDLLVAGAAAAAGALFGFVFGIPRSMEPASRAAVAVVAAAKPADAAASRAAMGVNTNLERISDWLTTLLIGATLVQIKDIAAWVSGLGKNLLATGPAANEAIVPIIVIYFFALAFLGVYLITRLYLTSALGLLGMSAGGPRFETDPAAAKAAADAEAAKAAADLAAKTAADAEAAKAAADLAAKTAADAEAAKTAADLAAAKTAPDIAVLKQQLSAALASSEPDALPTAITAYDNFVSTGANADDPELNANVVRILAKQMRTTATTERAADLTAALAKAAADPATKAQLKAEADSKQLTTGNAALDAEITAALS